MAGVTVTVPAPAHLVCGSRGVYVSGIDQVCDCGVEVGVAVNGLVDVGDVASFFRADDAPL